MSRVRRALKDILAGTIFIVLGIGFAVSALAYDLGTLVNMGPGYMPLALGLTLAVLGGFVIIKGFVAEEAGEPIGTVDWRALGLITASLVFFGLTVRGLGVIGSLFGTGLMASLARSQTPVWQAVVIAVGLTVLSVLIFVFALQLRLPLVGPWIPV